MYKGLIEEMRRLRDVWTGLQGTIHGSQIEARYRKAVLKRRQGLDDALAGGTSDRQLKLLWNRSTFNFVKHFEHVVRDHTPRPIPVIDTGGSQPSSTLATTPSATQRPPENNAEPQAPTTEPAVTPLGFRTEDTQSIPSVPEPEATQRFRMHRSTPRVKPSPPAPQASNDDVLRGTESEAARRTARDLKAEHVPLFRWQDFETPKPFRLVDEPFVQKEQQASSSSPNALRVRRRERRQARQKAVLRQGRTPSHRFLRRVNKGWQDTALRKVESQGENSFRRITLVPLVASVAPDSRLLASRAMVRHQRKRSQQLAKESAKKRLWELVGQITADNTRESQSRTRDERSRLRGFERDSLVDSVTGLFRAGG